jgi:hypothetical protein
MEVAGQELDDAKVVELLEQLKLTMDSPDGERSLRRFGRGGPFGQEWADFIQLAMQLFAPPAQPQSQEGA